MTAEELAALGYRPDMGGPALNQAVADVSPQDLQRFYAMSGGTPSPEPAMVPDQVDPALLAQLMGTPAPQSQMDQVTANQMAMMGVPPPSDPNGLTTGPDTQAIGPDGSQLQLPPSTGAANTYGGMPPQQNDQPGFYKWAKENYGLERGQQITVQEKLKAMELYSDYQKELLKQQDPEKLLKIKKDQVELQKSTMEQSDAVAKKADAIPELQNNVQLLDDLLSAKGLSSAVGAKDAAFLFGLKKDPLAGTEAADFMARLEQVQGKNFLAAFNQLKGAGQITELEGAKAQAALGRLGTNQSEGEFRKSVAELRGILQTGMDRSKARLGNQGQLPPTASLPGAALSSAPSSAAPMIKTIPGRGTFQSLGNGQWKQIQ